LKILFVAPSNSVHTKRWIRNAVNSGLDVYFFDQNPSSSGLNIDGVTELSSSVPASLKYLPKPFAEVIKLAFLLRNFKSLRRSIPFDLVHIHWLFDAAAYAASRVFSRNLVSTPWGSDVQMARTPGINGFLKSRLNYLYVHSILDKSSKVCCDSNLLKSSLSKYSINTQKIDIIYFGTDIESFKPSNRNEDLRSRLGFNPENVVILSNRGHEPVYDIPILINSAPSILSKFPNARFVIAGSGSLTESYKDLVSELKLSDFFVFPGRLNDSDFVNITASCDIYVSTSKSDGGLAASTAEAMASGLPVVISNFGENSNWLDDETAGLLFSIGSSSELAIRLEELIENQSKRIRMGEIGRAIILKRNNAKLEWEKVLSLYSKLTTAK
jgi:glycosyltransferase involved in cell wall biosynthesis